MSAGSLAAKIVEEARSQLGISEHPLGSNTGPDVEKYQRATFLSGTSWPWCAAFYCWCNKAAGAPLPYPSAGAYDLLNWAKKYGHSPSVPQPGDGVVFNIGSGHIGVCAGIRGDMIETIDGNWGDHVAEHLSPRSIVRGYVRNPQIAGIARTEDVTPKRRPIFVVTTSVSGHKKIVYGAHEKGVMHFLHRSGLLKRYPNGITISKKKV